MTRLLRAAAVIVGVVGAVVVAIAMLAGPLTDDPAPGAIERFVILAYPICLLLGGLFATIRIQAGLVYGGLATLFAVITTVMELTGDDSSWSEVVAILMVAPALVLASLCWSVLRSTGESI